MAGVHMCNGSSVMEGFIPDVDATVVTRILDAGIGNLMILSLSTMIYAYCLN